MKKSILKIGKELGKKEQQAIQGGVGDCVNEPYNCNSGCAYCIEEFIWNYVEGCFDSVWTCVPWGGRGGTQ